MEAIVSKALEGQPLVTVLLAIAVAVLWRDLQKEREARNALFQQIVEHGAVTTATIAGLRDTIVSMRDTLRGRGE